MQQDPTASTRDNDQGTGPDPAVNTPPGHSDAAARLALDRAHDAALNANGAELRRSLEEAHAILAVSRPPLASQLATALTDLDNGALAELETLLETVRSELRAGDEPGARPIGLL